MGFNADNLRRPLVEVEWCPHATPAGEGLKMKLNLDLLTIEKMDELDAEFKSTIKAVEESKKEGTEENLSLFMFDKANVKFKARSLGGGPGEDKPDERFIHSWNMTDKEKNPIPVSYEFLAAMPKPVIDELYKFVTQEAGKPTKKTESA